MVPGSARLENRKAISVGARIDELFQDIDPRGLGSYGRLLDEIRDVAQVAWVAHGPLAREVIREALIATVCDSGMVRWSAAENIVNMAYAECYDTLERAGLAAEEGA